jgi:hypothetical protein
LVGAFFCWLFFPVLKAGVGFTFMHGGRKPMDFDLVAKLLDLNAEEREWAEDRYERDDQRDRARLWSMLASAPVRRGRKKVLRRWSDTRLKQLFDVFAERLWPDRKLNQWRVIARHFKREERCRGFCSLECEYIVIDLALCQSDRAVRGILLHEMCHAVCNGGHDLRFFREVERLLAFGVPVNVDFSLYMNEPDVETVRATLPRCAALAVRAERRAETVGGGVDGQIGDADRNSESAEISSSLAVSLLQDLM